MRTETEWGGDDRGCLRATAALLALAGVAVVVLAGLVLTVCVPVIYQFAPALLLVCPVRVLRQWSCSCGWSNDNIRWTCSNCGRSRGA